MASEQQYFEDVEPGDAIGPVRRAPTHAEIYTYLSAVGGPAGAVSGRFYDDAAARAEGLPSAIVPGRLSVSMLAQLLTDWAAPGGRLRKLEVNFRRLALVGDPLACQGIVIDKALVDGEGHVHVDVAIDNLRQGDKPTVGTAVVILPRRT